VKTIANSKIIGMLKQKIDPVTISRNLDIPLNRVLAIMRTNTHLVRKNYKNVVAIEDKIDRTLKYMDERKAVAKRIPIKQTVVKLRHFLKKPHTTWECFEHIRVPYRKLYGAFKRLGVLRANSLSPLSLDLVLSQKMRRKIDLQQWRKHQITDLYKKHDVFMRKTIKIVERFQDITEKYHPGDMGTVRVPQGINIYTDYLSLHNEYPSFILQIENYLKFMKTNFTFSDYQLEVILGYLLQIKKVDLIGFKKDSAYFTTIGKYPLFIINNEAFKDFCWGVRKALLAMELLAVGENPQGDEWVRVMHKEIDHLPDSQVRQEIFDGALQTFKPDLANYLKKVCWQSPTILMELYKFIIFHKNEYIPVTADYVQKESIKGGSSEAFMEIQSHLNAQINNKVNYMMAEGFFKYYNAFDVEDIFDALSFFEVRYQFCFYLMCNLYGISVFEDLSKTYLKRMKPRPIKEYGE
jgi:hypothetical protein